MKPSFSAVLLAGGKSTRMGRDKAFVEVEGVPLWRRQMHTLEQLAPAEIFISGPPHREWIEAGCNIVADAQDAVGPLAGVIATLRKSSTSRLLVLGVDLPKMSAEYLRQLLEFGSGIVPKSARRFEPLAAVYPTASLPIAEELAAAGKFSLQGFAAHCVAEALLVEQPIAPHEEPLFRNANTPADLL